MVKPDETKLRELMLCRVANTSPPLTELAKQVPMSGKRALSLALKWDRKGWVEYGVSINHAWMTQQGREAWR